MGLKYLETILVVLMLRINCMNSGALAKHFGSCKFNPAEIERAMLTDTEEANQQVHLLIKIRLKNLSKRLLF